MGDGPREAPYFFLSYTRADAKGEFLEKFFEDLRSEVAAITGRDEDHIAFRDVTDIGLGKEWRPELIRALSTCECFVPILTPRLVVHPFCGKEWSGFQHRLELSSPADDGKPSRLLPIWWRPFPEGQVLPQVVSDHQYLQGILGEAYAERGLLNLMRLGRYKDEYTDFLSRFANLMVEAVQSAPLTPLEHVLDLNSLDDAFAPAVEYLDPDYPPRSAANHVLLIIAAGTRKDLGSFRKEVACYGSVWWKWRPFSKISDTAMVVATSALAGEELRSAALILDGPLVEHLKESNEGDIFVVLVDPWSVSLPPYQQPLHSLDQWRFVSGAVLEVWQTDSETRRHRGDLQERVRAALPSLSATGLSTALFAVEAEHEIFAQQLVEIVAAIQGRMFGTLPNPRTVGGVVTAPPQLQGPAAQTG
jgi:FxsC-like protein